MLLIDENKNIQVSQYDTFSIRFRFSNYKLTNADKVVFAIKKTTNLQKLSTLTPFTIRTIISSTWWFRKEHLMPWNLVHTFMTLPSSTIRQSRF